MVAYLRLPIPPVPELNDEIRSVKGIRSQGEFVVQPHLGITVFMPVSRRSKQFHDFSFSKRCRQVPSLNIGDHHVTRWFSRTVHPQFSVKCHVCFGAWTTSRKSHKTQYTDNADSSVVHPIRSSLTDRLRGRNHEKAGGESERSPEEPSVTFPSPSTSKPGKSSGRPLRGPSPPTCFHQYSS